MQFELMGYKLRAEVVIICVLLGMVIGVNTLCSCSNVTVKEGMETLGANLKWSMGQGQPNSWSNRATKYADNLGYSETYQQFLQFKGTPIPLPEGQLDMFANNVVKPECCKSSEYSSSNGCVCLSAEQVNYINERGGNRSLAPADF
jgi:hypothetical protein